MSNCHGSRLSTLSSFLTLSRSLSFRLVKLHFSFASMVTSQPFRPMLVVYIDNVKTAEVITNSGLQKIKTVYGSLFVTK